MDETMKSRTVISWRWVLMIAGVSALIVGCLVKAGRIENLLLANALFALSNWRVKDFRVKEKEHKKQSKPKGPIGFSGHNCPAE
jgi:hypothetical protein